MKFTMGRRQKLSRSRRRDSQSPSQSSNNHNVLHCSGTSESSIAATPIRTRRYHHSSQINSPQTEICDVGWQSSSPITLTQVATLGGDDEFGEEREAAIKQLVENSVSSSSSTCTIHDLLAENRIEPERSKPVNRLSGERNRRPKGLKASVSAKQMLNRLNILFEIDEVAAGKTEQTEGENQVREKGSTDVPTISEASKPNVTPRSYPDSEPLFTQDTSANQSFDLFTQKGNHGPPGDSEKLPEDPKTIKKLDGSPLVNTGLSKKAFNRSVSPRYTSSPIQSPTVSKKGNQSCDDLWTDDDDSLVLKATQMDLFATPKASKRKLTETTPTHNSKVPKYQFDATILSPIPPRHSESCSAAQGMSNPPTNSAPFQSYYDRKKSQLNSQHNKNDKENISSGMCGKILPGAVQKSNMQRHASQQINTCMIVPAKNPAPFRTLSGTSSSVSLLTKQSTCTLNFTTGSNSASLMKPPSRPPMVTSKPLHVEAGKKFPTNNTHHNTQAAKIRPAVSTVPRTQSLNKPRHTVTPSATQAVNSSSRSLSTIKSQKFSEPVRRDTVTKTPPRTTTLGGRNASPNLMNTSLTDDLLATLAEPDDILDSQVERVLGGSQLPMKPEDEDSDDLLLMVKEAVDAGFEPTPRKGSKSEVKPFDSFPSDDELDEPQLLAMLDEAESTQSSQEKSGKSSDSSNKSTPSGKLSKLTLHSVPSSGIPANGKSQNIVHNKPSAVTNRTSFNTQFGSHGSCPQQIGLVQISGNLVSKTATVVASSSAPVVSMKSNLAKEQLISKAVKPPIVSQRQVAVNVPSKFAKAETKICSQAGTVRQVQPPPASNQKMNCSGTLSASQKYSPEEIERKKREAILRRKNKLQLKK